LKNRGFEVTKNNPQIFEDGAIRWNGAFYCSNANYVTSWRNSQFYRN